MSTATYVRYELIRTLRNRRFFAFTLGFPLIIYILVAAPNRGEQDLGGTGISAPLYFMVGLTAFGAMNAMLGVGGRIGFERTLGWTRQLRVTPLRPRVYLGSKLLGGYLVALLTMACVYAAGVALGVRLPAGEWLSMSGLLLAGLLPFAALGVAIGHLVSSDSVGPAIGGITALMGFLGGVWFPLGDGVMGEIGRCLPSYWLVQASQVSLGSGGWGVEGWLVMAGWMALLSALAVWAYRRDAGRP